MQPLDECRDCVAVAEGAKEKYIVCDLLQILITPGLTFSFSWFNQINVGGVAGSVNSNRKLTCSPTNIR